MWAENWKHPSLADTGASASVRCRCGRVCRPMEMLRVAGLPVAKGEPYLCATCVEDLFRKDQLDRLELGQSQGAPEEWLTGLESKLLQGPLLRCGLPQRVWGEILAVQLDAVAAAQAPPVDPPLPAG